MNNFKPGDVILMRSEETGPYRRLKDWLLGSPWGHYLGRDIPNKCPIGI